MSVEKVGDLDGAAADATTGGKVAVKDASTETTGWITAEEVHVLREKAEWLNAMQNLDLRDQSSRLLINKTWDRQECKGIKTTETTDWITTEEVYVLREKAERVDALQNLYFRDKSFRLSLERIWDRQERKGINKDRIIEIVFCVLVGVTALVCLFFGN